LVDELAGKGVDVSILTFFSWLGGTSLTHSRQ